MADSAGDAVRRIGIKLSALAQDGLAYAPPPPLPVHVYKLFFLCRRDGPARSPQPLETLDVGWFGLDELPPLSLSRVNHRQLARALAHHRDPSLATEFD